MCVCFFLNVPALVLRRDDADRQWAGPQQNRLNVQHICDNSRHDFLSGCWLVLFDFFVIGVLHVNVITRNVTNVSCSVLVQQEEHF